MAAIAPNLVSSADAVATHEPAVTQRRVVVSEWIKFRSVRSNVVALVGAGVVAVLLGAMFASFAGSDAAAGPAAASSDPLRLSLGGFSLAQLVVGVVGVLVASSEYATGLARTTFSAVTDRARVVRAKGLVVGGLALATGIVAALLAFLVGSLTYAGTEAVPGLTDPEVLRAIAGMGVYLAGVGVIGVCLGFLLRSTAAGVGVLAVALLIVPGLAQLLPASISDVVVPLLPSSAGAAFANEAIAMGSSGSSLLSAPAGLAAFALWVVGLLVAAVVVVRRRDA